MNNYVTQYGEGENIFLITQYFINSYLNNSEYPNFDYDLSAIRKGAKYTINYNEKWTNKQGVVFTGTLEINGYKYRLPLDYASRLLSYKDAINIFK